MKEHSNAKNEIIAFHHFAILNTFKNAEDLKTVGMEYIENEDLVYDIDTEFSIKSGLHESNYRASCGKIYYRDPPRDLHPELTITFTTNMQLQGIPDYIARHPAFEEIAQGHAACNKNGYVFEIELAREEIIFDGLPNLS